MNKTLHLTHPEFDTSLVLPESILLEKVDQPLLGRQYHTSLGDLSASDVLELSKNFDTVNFVSDNFDVTSAIYHETVILLNYLSHRKTVTGYSVLEKQEFLSADVNDRPDRPVVWVFGCSHSYGLGLLPDQKNFAQHISLRTQLPLKLIARPGSSVQWSLRHIVHSNFRPGDLVIWQLTSPERISYGYPPTELPLTQCRSMPILETYNDQHLLFNQLSMFNQGIKYLKSQSIKFVVVAINNKSPLFYPCLKEYTKHSEFCFIPHYSLDLGTDGKHLGPLSHQSLAESILNHVNCSND